MDVCACQSTTSSSSSFCVSSILPLDWMMANIIPLSIKAIDRGYFYTSPYYIIINSFILTHSVDIGTFFNLWPASVFSAHLQIPSTSVMSRDGAKEIENEWDFSMRYNSHFGKDHHHRHHHHSWPSGCVWTVILCTATLTLFDIDQEMSDIGLLSIFL